MSKKTKAISFKIVLDKKKSETQIKQTWSINENIRRLKLCLMNVHSNIQLIDAHETHETHIIGS